MKWFRTAALALVVTSCPLSASAELKKHVDRENGFAATYDDLLSPIEPNEAVSKLVLTSGDGYRCWVVFVPNHLITEENKAEVLSSVISNPESLRAEYLKLYKDVSEVTANPTVLSGNRDAVLIAYAATYEALGQELLISIVEGQLFIPGKTIKIGCSTALTLDDRFRTVAANFLRGFQLLPPEQ